MIANTTVTLLRLNVSEHDDYALTLPIRDLHEFFVAMDWYEDFLDKNYITIELDGAFDFLVYEESIDLELLNNCLLRFQQLSDLEQETVIWLTHLNGDTLSALHYSLVNFNKYLLVPAIYRTEETIAKFVIKQIYPNNLLNIFEDSICFEDFCNCMFKNQIAFYIDNRILVKIVDLID